MYKVRESHSSESLRLPSFACEAAAEASERAWRLYSSSSMSAKLASSFSRSSGPRAPPDSRRGLASKDFLMVDSMRSIASFATWSMFWAMACADSVLRESSIIASAKTELISSARSTVDLKEDFVMPSFGSRGVLLGSDPGTAWNAVRTEAGSSGAAIGSAWDPLSAAPSAHARRSIVSRAWLPRLASPSASAGRGASS